MRRAIHIGAILAGLALVFAAAAAPAYADGGKGNGKGNGNPPAHAGGSGNNGGNGNGNGGGASENVGGNASAQDPRGFNGHIKVHDGDREPEPIVRNEPQVGCSFHIHGFDFDRSASGTWSVQSWPPTGDRSVVLSGTWTADNDGNWRTAVMAISSGHYRVNADQTSPAAPGAEKHKMFWARCGAAAGGGEEAEGEQEKNVGGQQENNVGGQQENNVGGQQENNAVAGVEQGPMVGPVSPTVETAAQPGAQAAAQVAGQQAAPVTALPATSTEAAPSILALLTGIGVWLTRRRLGGR